MRRIAIGLLLALALAGAAWSQESASYRLTETSFDTGGQAGGDTVTGSTSFVVTLGALGSGGEAPMMSGPTYAMEGGFVASFQPPTEVAELLFTDATTLVWAPEGSVGDYALYSGMVAVPFDSEYGTCSQPPPQITATTATVTSIPPPGGALFFLVSARNRLGEEGIKGLNSNGVIRANTAPCL